MKKLIAAMVFVMLDVTLNSAAAESISRGSTAPWTAFYMGAGIGGKWANSDWTTNCFGSACSSGGDNPFFVDASSPRPFDVSMFHGTVYGGFNWQLGHWVVGVEGDLGSGNKSKVTRVFQVAQQIAGICLQLQRTSTVRRLGWCGTPAFAVAQDFYLRQTYLFSARLA